MERPTVVEALRQSVTVAALLMPLAADGSSTAFTLDQLQVLSEDAALASSFDNRYWVDLTTRKTLTLEDLTVLERFGPAACAPQFGGDFDTELAEIVLGDPSRYPSTLLHTADKTVHETTSLAPLAAVADRDEWFSLPD